MKYLKLRVVERGFTPTQTSAKEQLLAILQTGANEGKTLPELIETIVDWRDHHPLNYRDTLIDITTGREAFALDEARARAKILDVLEPLGDGEVAEFKDDVHAKLVELLKAYKVPATRAWVRLCDDVEYAPALPEITAADLAEPATTPETMEEIGTYVDEARAAREQQQNGRALYPVGVEG